MRRFSTILAAALLCAAPAAAQESASIGFGPYRLGMSPDEARTAAEVPGWSLQQQAGDSISLRANGPVMIGALVFVPVLSFDGAELTRIQILTAEREVTSARCDQLTDQVVAILERDGALTGERAVNEPETANEQRVTRGGSNVRVYARENGGRSSFANRARDGYAEINARFGAIFPQAPNVRVCAIEALISGAEPVDVAALQSSAPTEAELEQAMLIEQARWIERPNAQTFARHYPVLALESGVGGTVDLDCLVADDGRLRCRVVAEDPARLGFGPAALAIAQDFRMAAEVDGESTAGKRVRVPIRFNVMR